MYIVQSVSHFVGSWIGWDVCS